MKRLLLVKDAAKALGVSPQGVRFFEGSGQLKAYAKSPSGVRVFLPATVEALKRSREAKRGRA